MNEWKLIGISSLVVNMLMVALLFGAVFIVKGVVEDKNQSIIQLEKEVVQLKEQTTREVAVAEEPDEKKVEADVEVEASKKESVITEKPAQKSVSSQTKPATVSQTNYKEKLISYKPSLEEDYDYVYYLYDGWDIDMMYEDMSNAEIRAELEGIYQKSDAILNKVYNILKENLPAAQFTELQVEQRAWLQRVTKSKEKRLAMGGSSAGIDVADELGRETQERCVELMIKYFGFVDYYGQ